MIRRLAIGAAGAAAVGLASSQRAAAGVDGDVVLGDANTTAGRTQITYTGPADGVGFLVRTGTDFAADSTANYPSVLGAYANSTGATARNGLYGYTRWADQAGVVGYGAAAIPGTIGGRFQGARAAVNLVSSGAVGAVAAGAHKVGDVIRTDDGDLWYVAADGTPGALRRLSGAGTVGSLSLAAPPKRVYDSRSGARLAAGSTTVVDLKKTDLTGVPAGAIAGLLTITATQVTANGFLTAYSNAIATVPDTSTLNFTANQDIATTTVVACDAEAKIKITVGPNTSLHVIVDYVGYYR